MAAYAAGVALIKAALPGDRAAAFTAARRGVARSLAWHSHALIALGTNDVGAGAVGAGLGASAGDLADAMRAVNPRIRYWAATLPLRCSASSDNSATLARQTVQAGWSPG